MSKFPLVLPVVVAALALGGCGPSQPDYSPFGDGLKAIAIAFVVYAVVNALAALVMADDRKPKDPPPPKPRKSRDRTPSKGGDT